ncbi:MAG: hypothetical protein AMXMBFR84_16540 [Candidatus Hydrogenedentota bacterium]
MHGPHENDVRQTGLLWTAKDVAQACSISTRQVFRMRDKGAMPRPIRIGGAVRWRIAEIEQWIADGCPDVRTTRPRR